MSNIIRHEGRWCPVGATKAWDKYTKSALDMSNALVRCKDRKVVIQAGGNIGAWPVWLSKRFKEVITFEPDLTNFQCLVRNVEPHTNIEPYNAALGPDCGYCNLVLERGMGGHHVDKIGSGSCRMLSVDSFELQHLDLLVLDVEGMEYEALVGARETIARHHPVIQLEDKNHGVNKGRGKTMTDIINELKDYEIVNRVGRDVIFQWKS